MAVKAVNFRIQGMQRDLSASVFNPKFAYENMNIRITPDKENTLLSITNEKGTLSVGNIEGCPIGIAIIRDKAVVFSVKEDTDYITVLTVEDNNLKVSNIWSGNLNFSIDHPIETLVYYESDKVQKVYWTDYLNPLRCVNISDVDELDENYKFEFVEEIGSSISVKVERKDLGLGSFPAGIIQYFITYYNKYGQESGIVYQSPMYYTSMTDRGATGEETCTCSFDIEITDFDSTWDYLRVYSIHRTSINSTVSAYIVNDINLKSLSGNTISISDLGVNEAIGDTDLLYKTRSPMIAGSLAQKYNVLFASNIKTIDEGINTFKDNEAIESDIRTGFSISEYSRKISYYEPSGVYPYDNELKNSYWDLVHFKGGDKYRIGIQCQNKYGEWSNPVFVGDYEIKTYPYIDMEGDNYYKFLPSIKVSIDSSIINQLKNDGVIAVRGLIARPIIGKRNIYAQGVINSTVYNINDRLNNNIYGAASWFFRPLRITMGVADSPEISDNELRYPEYRHDYPLGGGNVRNGEIQLASGEESAWYNFEDITNQFIIKLSYTVLHDSLKYYYTDIYIMVNGVQGKKIAEKTSLNLIDANNFVHKYFPDITYTEEQYKNKESFQVSNIKLSELGNQEARYNGSNYFVDQNLLTFNSPDIDENFNANLSNFKIRIVGIIPITANYSSYGVTTDGTKYNLSARGLISKSFNHFNISYEASGLISYPLWEDSPVDDETTIKHSYVLYPWQRSGSLGDQSSEKLEEDAVRYSILDTKVISNLRYSYAPIYFNTKINGKDLRYIMPCSSEIHIFNSNESTGTVIDINDNPYVYFGNLDTLVNKYDLDSEGAETTSYNIYYSEEDDPLIYSNDEDVTGVEPVSIKYKSTPHLFFKLDSIISGGSITDYIMPVLFREYGYVYDDAEQYLFGKGIPMYHDLNYNIIVYGKKETYTKLFTNDEIGKYYFMKLPTIEGAAVGIDGYHLILVTSTSSFDIQYIDTGATYLKSDFSGVYHVNIGGLYTDRVEEEPIPVYITQDYVDKNVSSSAEEGTGSIILNNSFYKKLMGADDESGCAGILYLAELYREADYTELYGSHSSKEDLERLTWEINSNPVSLDNSTGSIDLELYGDTYFSRWDCLKTYPFTIEDENQIVEILSFMVESNINLDGRTDRNRGLSNNNNVLPTNFNIYNEVYNQRDNYFSYRTIENDNNLLGSTIVWSTKKTALEEIDSWTQLYLTNSIDVNSQYGEITRLASLNDRLIFFQDSALGQLLYNENAQIATTAGVPVELGNSGEVTGYKYISNSIGLPYKWSLCEGNGTIYFIDPNSSGIYRLSDGITSLSDSLGYRTWINSNADKVKNWNPRDFNGFVLYYDKLNSEVYIIGKEQCLVYSELLGQFTSFYSYESTPYYFTINTEGYFLRNDGGIWKQHGGDYNKFFNKLKEYYVTVIANPDPTKDKIFNNIEFRADVLVDGKANNIPPFNKLTVWNEYQNGTSALSFNMSKISNLKKKFRIWRALIPRDDSNHRDRIRNPWAYIRLSKDEETQDTNKVILHDMTVYYFD